MKVNKPIPRLTRANLGDIIDKYPTKYEIGFTIWEVRELLRPNKLEEQLFRKGMFGSTYALLDNNPVFYHRDVYNILRELL